VQQPQGYGAAAGVVCIQARQAAKGEKTKGKKAGKGKKAKK
jgi:hypothetical protein